MPPNTVNVARGPRRKWGNPFKVGEHAETNEQAVHMFYSMFHDPDAWADEYPMDEIEQLRGKNLACWCDLDEPCHADVLLKMANDENEANR